MTWMLLSLVEAASLRDIDQKGQLLTQGKEETILVEMPRGPGLLEV